MKLLYPFDGDYQVTSNYAAHLSDPTRKNFPGTDYAIPTGHSVKAPAPGSFDVYIASADLGNDAVLIHQMGKDQWRWDFCHCSKLYNTTYNVHAVEQGATLALTGNTGNSTGPHCHVTLRINGAFVDPEPILNDIKAGRIVIPGTEVTEEEVAALKAKQQEALAKISELTALVTQKDSEIILAKTELGDKVNTTLAEKKLLQEELDKYIEAAKGLNIRFNLEGVISDVAKGLGLRTRWGEWVDAHIKSEKLAQILKYEIFVLLGMLAGLPTIGTWLLSSGTALSIANLANGLLSSLNISGEVSDVGVAALVVGVCATLFKLLVARYDKNGDGKLDLGDTEIIKEYLTVAKTV